MAKTFQFFQFVQNPVKSSDKLDNDLISLGQLSKKPDTVSHPSPILANDTITQAPSRKHP